MTDKKKKKEGREFSGIEYSEVSVLYYQNWKRRLKI